MKKTYSELIEYYENVSPREIITDMYFDHKEEIDNLNNLGKQLVEENKQLKIQLQQKENIIKEVREKVDNFDVFKEFTFPLMKRDEEQQVKSSIDYEWKKSIKEPILEILDKGE